MLPKIMVDSIHSINKNENNNDSDSGDDHDLGTVLAFSALKIGISILSISKAVRLDE